MANEKRLIPESERERLIRCLKRIHDADFTPGVYEHSVYGRAAMFLEETADAVEVVHGRCKWCNGEYHTKIMATAIRYHSNGNMSGYEMKVNYCPNCGADMRERSEGE